MEGKKPCPSCWHGEGGGLLSKPFANPSTVNPTMISISASLGFLHEHFLSPRLLAPLYGEFRGFLFFVSFFPLPESIPIQGFPAGQSPCPAGKGNGTAWLLFLQLLLRLAQQPQG